MFQLVREPKGPALWWVRRDLRLHDNPALTAALQHATVVPVFVLEPALESASSRQTAFLQASLTALDRSLRERGCSLVVRRGNPAQVLAELCAEVGAVAVYAQADVSPFGRLREQQVSQTVPLQLVAWPTLYPPGAVTNIHGKPYTLYGAFRRAALALPAPPILPSPQRLPPHGVRGEPLPAVSLPVGEPDALCRLGTFRKERLLRYHRDRNRLDRNATSGLSAELRFGLLSPRLAYRMAVEAAAAAPDEDARRGAETWRDELLWRDFFAHLLYHFPHTRDEPLRAEYRNFRWDNDEKLFRVWCEGCTGYPVVDAAMRQLAQTGWIHNRARMVAASFLVKNLLVDWRWGERSFLQQLVDGDPASNAGNWQWVAGVGADAAPYFRVFNPVLQGQRFDPEGTYVRRWIPELARVPTPYVHAPWTLPRDDQIAYGCRVGRDYPAPVVDLAASRLRALERYRAARGSQGGPHPRILQT